MQTIRAEVVKNPIPSWQLTTKDEGLTIKVRQKSWKQRRNEPTASLVWNSQTNDSSGGLEDVLDKANSSLDTSRKLIEEAGQNPNISSDRCLLLLEEARQLADEGLQQALSKINDAIGWD